MRNRARKKARRTEQDKGSWMAWVSAWPWLGGANMCLAMIFLPDIYFILKKFFEVDMSFWTLNLMELCIVYVLFCFLHYDFASIYRVPIWESIAFLIPLSTLYWGFGAAFLMYDPKQPNFFSY